MRKCEFKIYRRTKDVGKYGEAGYMAGAHRYFKFVGVFHEWGLAAGVEEGSDSYSIGLVELTEFVDDPTNIYQGHDIEIGRMFEVDINKIKFLQNV